MMKLAKYIGIPYKSKGRSAAGVDCYGLLYLLYRDMFNIEIPSYVDEYVDAKHSKTVSDAIIDNLHNWREVQKPEFGDLLVFNVLGLPTHTAMYINGGNFVHSFMGTDTCIERINSITWKRRLQGVYRWVKT